MDILDFIWYTIVAAFVGVVLIAIIVIGRMVYWGNYDFPTHVQEAISEKKFDKAYKIIDNWEKHRFGKKEITVKESYKDKVLGEEIRLAILNGELNRIEDIASWREGGTERLPQILQSQKMLIFSRLKLADETTLKALCSYMNTSELENSSIPISNKLNILVAHCDLNGSKDDEGFSYNPVLESKLNSLGFDYVALGHVHKNNIDNKNRIYYPGSTISLGFDELGAHGMIAGNITKDNFSMEFVELDDRKFEELEVTVDDIYSKEDLAEKILNRYLNDMVMYKVILKGKRNFEIDTRELIRVLSHENILKIKDETKIAYDIEDLISQNNLKGLFVKEVYQMYKDGLCSEEEYQKAIEIGLEAM